MLTTLLELQELKPVIYNGTSCHKIYTKFAAVLKVK